MSCFATDLSLCMRISSSSPVFSIRSIKEPSAQVALVCLWARCLKHRKMTHWLHSFFIYHQTPDERDTAKTLISYRVKVLHSTRHKVGHFRDILPSQSLGFVLKNLNLRQPVHRRQGMETVQVTPLIRTLAPAACSLIRMR